LLAYLCALWQEQYALPEAEMRPYLDARLRDGSALLLLDALDETLEGDTREMAEQSYMRIITIISRLTKEYPLTPIIVTVRIAGYQQRAPLFDFTELEILDFRPQDIEQFVQNWFDHHPQQQFPNYAAKLNTELKQYPRIHTLTANPLLLALVVLVYQDQQKLPTRRAKLYEECVETLLVKWNTDVSRKEIPLRYHAFELDHKRQLLKKVAWKFHLRGRRYFDKQELLAIIDEFLRSERISNDGALVVLDEIAIESGLLREYATGWYGFLHLTLQEYFVALSVDEEPNGLETLLHHLENPWWEEVLYLYAGCTWQANRLLQVLLGRDTHGHHLKHETLFHSHLLLAGHCLAAHPFSVSSFTWHDIIEHLFEILLQTPYSLTRQQVAEVLAEIGEKEIQQRLLLLLDDPYTNRDVQLSILRGFGLFGDKDLAEEMVLLLEKELLDIEIRVCMAQELGRLAERSVVPNLVTLLSQRLLNSAIRCSVASALATLGEASIATQLVELLTNTQIEAKPYTDVRCSIADVLGLLGDHRVTGKLLLLYSDPQLDFSLRWHIAVTLGMLGEPDALEEIIPIISNRGYSIEKRREIIDAIGSLRLRSLIPTLSPLLTDEDIHWEVRVGVASALSATGDRLVFREFLQHIADEQINEYVRTSMSNLIGASGERQLVPTLERVSVDEQLYPLVYRSIFIARGCLGDASVVPWLQNWLANEDIAVEERLNCLDALCGYTDHTIISHFLGLLANPQTSKSIRRGIIFALTQLANIQAELDHVQEVLMGLLADPALSNDAHRTLWIVRRRLIAVTG
jgi:HEAT repeat protein